MKFSLGRVLLSGIPAGLFGMLVREATGSDIAGILVMTLAVLVMHSYLWERDRRNLDVTKTS